MIDRRTLLGGLGASVIIAPWSAAADPSDCPPGTKWDHDERSQAGNVVTITPVCRRSQPSCSELEEELKVLRNQMNFDNLEAARNSAALDEWSRLGDTARKNAQREAYSVGMEAAADAILIRIKQGAATDRIITAQDAGLLHSNWKITAARLIRMPPATKAQVLARLGNARTAEEGVQALRYGISAINTTYDTAALKFDPNWDQAKRAGLSILSMIELITYDNPVTGLLITDLKAGSNAIYGWWAVLAARNRLRQFLALEDHALERAIDRSNRYVDLTHRIQTGRCAVVA